MLIKFTPAIILWPCLILFNPREGHGQKFSDSSSIYNNNPHNIGFFDKRMTLRICNEDHINDLFITIATYTDLGTKIEGWYKFSAGSCRSISVWTNNGNYHHFLFNSNGKIVDFSPKVYELFGFRGTGALSKSDQSFCVNLTGATSIQSNIFSMGRETSCEGSESLTAFPVKMIGGYDEAELNVPAISSYTSGNTSSRNLLQRFLDWFR